MASSHISVDDVRGAVGDFKDPETGRNALETEQIRDIEVSQDQLSLTLALTTHSAPLSEVTEQLLRDKLHAALPQISSINIKRTVHERAPHALGEIGLKAKSVVAVGSGKGGVGKSTIATSLATGFQRAGCTVGLMDADVYGPSIPHLLGIEGRPEVVDNRIQPIHAHGMPVISMGFLVPKNEAIVWRGPMLHGAITQFLRDTNWGNLDYLIIDMPPGTGDIALTLSQLLPLTGAVVVCTPQDVALLDAMKAIAMFRKVNIPVLGMIENMSGFVCPDCQKKYDIFGSGGARDTAHELNVPFLGEVPISIDMRVRGDEGETTANFDDQVLAPYLEKICFQLAENLAAAAAKEPPSPSLPVLG